MVNETVQSVAVRKKISIYFDDYSAYDMQLYSYQYGHCRWVEMHFCPQAAAKKNVLCATENCTKPINRLEADIKEISYCVTA